MDYWKFAGMMIDAKNNAIAGQQTEVIIEELWYKLKADNEITKDVLLVVNAYCVDWAENHSIIESMIMGVTGNQMLLESAVGILTRTLKSILSESAKTKCLYPICIDMCDVDAEIDPDLSGDAYDDAYDEVYAGICDIQDEIDECVNDDWQDRYEVANAINEGNMVIAVMQEWGWPVHEHDGSWFVDEV